MLDISQFKAVIENTPLVSIDLCLIFEDQILLGMRQNEPLRGEWFTPGGRIYKNETWQNALLRISKLELGLRDAVTDSFSLMGIWDHFYNNSVVDQDISTHYVNLPHYAYFNAKPNLILDDQHSKFSWFDLSLVSNSDTFHRYMRTYATWILNREKNSHD